MILNTSTVTIDESGLSISKIDNIVNAMCDFKIVRGHQNQAGLDN